MSRRPVSGRGRWPGRMGWPAAGAPGWRLPGVVLGRDGPDLVGQPDPVATVDVPGQPDRAILGVSRAVHHDHRRARAEPEERELTGVRHPRADLVDEAHLRIAEFVQQPDAAVRDLARLLKRRAFSYVERKVRR